jgi:glutathione S-transferase
MLVSLVLSAIGSSCWAILAVSVAIVALCLALVPLLLLARALLPRPVLLSLPYSHFVESARWAIERPAGGAAPEPFIELKLPVGPHFLITALYRILFGGRNASTSYPGSSVPTPPWLRWTAWAPAVRRLSGLPCFVTADARCLQDSWAILRHFGYDVRPDLAAELDERLGPSVRQIGYYYIFRQPGMYRSLQSCGPVLMALFDAFDAILRISSMMPALMDINEGAIDTAAAAVRETFEHVDTILATAPYLGDGSGEEDFGGADLAFSALSAWLLQPIALFHNGACDVPPPETMLREPKFAELVAELRATRAGKHVLRCYAEHRLTPPAEPRKER